LEVTDGTNTVTGVTEIDFTSGATVTASGATAQVAVSGGGGGQTGHQEWDGLNVSIGNGTSGLITFDDNDGPDSLLNNSTLTAPTIITTGSYVICACVVATNPLTAGGWFQAQLFLGNGPEMKQDSAVASAAHLEPALYVGGCWHFTAGDTVQIRVFNFDGSSTQTFKLFDFGIIRTA